MAKRPDSVTVRFAQPLKIETAAPLAVRQEPAPSGPPSRREQVARYAARLVLMLTPGIYAFFAVRYLLPRQTPPPETLAGMSLSFSAPSACARS